MGRFSKLRDWWEEITYKAYYAYVDVWYFIKHLPDTIKRIVYYFPIIVKMHDWDGNNIIYLSVAEIERLEHYFRDKDDIIADEDKAKIIAEIQSAKVAGHRVIDGLNGVYLEELWKKYEIPEDYFGKLDTVEQLENYYNNPTPEQQAIHEKVYQLGKEEDAMLRDAEIKFFDAIREHHLNWWS